MNDTWKMTGPKKVLVNRISATMPRLWESDDEPFDRTHSDLVKYCDYDVCYERVLARLRKIASKATAILTSQYLSQGIQRYPFPLPCAPPMADNHIVIESPDSFGEDEVACLQSLSFAEIYARENIIEPALQHTGSWLLESKDFNDWSRRDRLDEHRGFFWIQGNPGSGKSTLMKKAYSHVQACSQDPSTVIAAFFFNARGSEIEKSPTGLFLTLLHRLCQRVSALRNLVVKAFVAKRRLSKFDVQWQLSELKDFLAAVVTSSVLGRRKLLLIIDALDECEEAAIQSVVQTFEDLASAALSENTNFNVCLSSRYWPQIRIPKCFMARVELKNHSDIEIYIQERLKSAHINEEDLTLFDTLKSKILKKAKGTFLWVVLVVQDLLHANIAGATLRELRDIVQRVPKDLGEFYKHQLQSAKGEDRKRMLRLFQVVFYAQRPLSPTELRYALAFGSKAYASYAEWSQSSEYIRSDEQMEKRVREHSKGLVEFAQLPRDNKHLQELDEEHIQDSAQSLKAVVQFVHQSVMDFLTADGFSCLSDTQWPTQSAKGHEFMKRTCLNYLRAKELDAMLDVDARVSEAFDSSRREPDLSTLAAAHPLLQYAVNYILPHAALAEKHGISQDSFRAYVCGNTEAYFERWRYLHDMFLKPWDEFYQGDGARPIHIFAEHGLLSKEIAEKEANIDVAGGEHKSALATACKQGHEDTVELLLSLGADPIRRESFSGGDHGDCILAFASAISHQHLPILRRLMNDPRSSLTLSDRLSLVKFLRDSGPHSKAMLDLLLPEATFPDSVNEIVCSIARYCTPETLSFLLDKSRESILHEEKLWCETVSGGSDTMSRLRLLLPEATFPDSVNEIVCSIARYCTPETLSFLLDKSRESIFVSGGSDTMSKLRILLDHGGTVEITGTFLRHCRWKPVKIIKLLILEDCEVEMTDDLMNAICSLTDSSQTLSAFESLDYRFKAFTREQLLQVLRHGSAESAGFFLQRNNYNVSIDEILISVLGNYAYGLEVSRLVLGYLDPDSISEQTIIAALGNYKSGGDLVRLLHSRRSGLVFSEAVLTVAVERQTTDVVEFILANYECATISEIIFTSAFSKYSRDSGERKAELLLLHDPDIEVRESTVIKAIRYCSSPRSTLTTLCKHKKSLFCTEDVVMEAVSSCHQPEVLEIILQQDRSIKISSTMIMAAMRSPFAAALISVMLHHDHALVIEEEHLIEAAAFCSTMIFELLQRKGLLDVAGPASESLSTSTAKRRKVTHKPPLRISTGVLNAALSNPYEEARGPLLRLFLKWGIITEMDYTHGMSNPINRSHRPSTITLPSISELFPDL